MFLDGKSALIIGGTHGMGAATAERLRDLGARVVVTGRNPGETHQGMTALRLDLADVAQVAALPRSLPAGPIDAIFVFAGMAELRPLAEVTPAEVQAAFAVNALGPFFAVQSLLPRLGDGGSITLTTVTPATATPGMGIYMASKAALRSWAQVLAAELLPRRIRVNLLAPGFIDTPTLGLASLSPSQREAFRGIGDAATPMQRHGTMDEIARAALFLAFDATFSTGIELPVDGGLSSVDAP